MNYLLVITRENRAERPVEAILKATATGIENAVGAGVSIPSPTTDSFLYLSNVFDINARITKYLSSLRYATLAPQTNDGYFIVSYSCDNTLIDFTGFPKYEVQIFLANGTDSSHSFATLAEAENLISTLGASDGFNLIGNYEGTLSQYLNCRPLLRKENNPFLVPDLNVVNAFANRKSEYDRF